MDENRIMEFFETMRKFAKFRENFAPITADISQHEFWVLNIIYFVHKENEDENVTVAQIKKHIKMTGSAISQVLNVLENKKFIKRTISKTDRRCVFIHLTEKGNITMEAEKEHIMEKFNLIIHEFGYNNFDKMIAGLKEFLAVAEKISEEGVNNIAKT